MPTVVLPRLLEPVVGDQLRVEVEGSTLAEALEGLFTLHPGLRSHLLDTDGRLRPHVHCFVDGAGTHLTDRTLAVDAATEIRFLQAVSGG